MSDGQDVKESTELIQRAGRAALEAANMVLEEGGAKLNSMVVMLGADDVPEGESAAITATKNIVGKPELFKFLMGYTVMVGKEIGMQFPQANRPIIHRPGGGRLNGGG